MNTISSIIQTLSQEEKANFLNQLKKKNKRSDTKNIQLFKLLDGALQTKDLDIKLYGKKSKGAFHALCKRLHDSLIDHIATKSFDENTSEEMEILKLLIASRMFFEQKQYKIAIKTIKKAEQKAKSYDLFSILNEIYYTKIQYASLDQKLPLETLISEFKSNKKSLQQEENLNLFYATVQNEFTQNHRDINLILTTNLEKFNISIAQNLTFRSLFKILEITNQSANITRDYHAILPFVEKSYQLVNKEDRITQKHLFYHIQILYYVANSYFRNRYFETSQKHLAAMQKQMIQQNKKYHRRFTPQHLLLITLNLNYSGSAKKAISLLENFEYNKYKDQITYILDLKLSLVVFYFQQTEFKKALRLLNEFYHSDVWYTEKASILWVIKKNLIEILLHIELDHFELVDSRLKSFKKKHSAYLKTNKESRVLDFVNLVTQLYYYPERIENQKYISQIHKLTDSLNITKEDIFTLSFYAWIKAKIDNSNLYKTTLLLLR